MIDRDLAELYGVELRCKIKLLNVIWRDFLNVSVFN